MLIIAKNTFLEFWRSKIIYVILFLSFCLILFSFFLGELSLSDNSRIVNDFSLMVIEFFGLIILLFFGSKLFYNEHKNKTYDLIILNNKSISDFILGKFIGFVFVMFMFFFVIFIFYFLFYLFLGFDVDNLFYLTVLSIVFIFLKNVLLIGVLLFFCAICSPIIAIFVTISVYFIGHSLSFLKYYLSYDTSGNQIMVNLIDFLYYFMPRFDLLNFKDVIYNPLVVELSFFYFFGIFFFVLLYVFVLLFMTIKVYKYVDKV